MTKLHNGLASSMCDLISLMLLFWTFCRTGSDYMHVLTTNVVGPYLTTKHLLPLLKKKKTRVVVNTSSLYDSMNATYDDTDGHHNPTGSVLLPSNTSKAAINMRKLQCTLLGNSACNCSMVLICSTRADVLI